MVIKEAKRVVCGPWQSKLQLGMAPDDDGDEYRSLGNTEALEYAPGTQGVIPGIFLETGNWAIAENIL